MQTIEDFGDAILVSITEALQNLIGFLPTLLGALIVLIIGWWIAGGLARLTEAILTRIGFERATESTGVADFIRRSGTTWTASHVIAEIVKWFIRLIAIQAAASILGMPQITEIINEIVLFLPNIVVAIVIIVVGALIAGVVAGIVRGSTSDMGFANPQLLASVARYAILVFAVVAAVNQLGIAETVVNALFIGAVAATAGAAAIAFGLGGQGVAADISRSWQQTVGNASRRIASGSGGTGRASAPATPPQATPPPAPPTEGGETSG